MGFFSFLKKGERKKLDPIINPETGKSFYPATDAEATAMAIPKEESTSPVSKLATEGKETVLQQAESVALKQLVNNSNLVTTEGAGQSMGGEKRA